MIKRICYLILITSCFSFSLKKERKFIPPGTVQISETFFADACEISNLSWCEYEFWVKAKYGPNSKEHLATLPDTAVWQDKNAYNVMYANYYYRHVAYKNYPVVGISYDQAVAFCKWRTDRVKEFSLLREKKSYDIEYRLPTKEEWELLSTNGSWVFNNGKNKKGVFVINCYNPNDTLIAGNSDVTAPVTWYPKNSFGLFNTIGNVSEMVSEQGISKGGSWRHTFENCRPGKNIPYSKPESWLGFRCVCVVKT
jgi:formylglycine-generating enzyme required for sulfatase activity